MLIQIDVYSALAFGIYNCVYVSLFLSLISVIQQAPIVPGRISIISWVITRALS